MKRFLKAPVCVALNVFVVYVLYMVCRIEFLLENWDMFALTFSWSEFWQIMQGGLKFDTSAICYTNVLYIALALLPLGPRITGAAAYKMATKLAYVIPNSIGVVLNLCDSVYYPYGQHRVTSRIFNEFGAEGNLGTIFGHEIVAHWYLVVLAAVMIFVMWRCYLWAPLVWPKTRRWRYFAGYTVFAACVVIVAVWGMRGATFFTSTRPIAVSAAHQYVERPSDTSLVLNTPFSLIRTIDKKPPRVPRFFTTGAELDAIYTPLHKAAPDSAAVRRKNVVILIVESFATEFIGGLNGNRNLDGGTYRGYTPFVDSLIPQSLTFEHTIANTNVSIDAMPAILASIPRMDYGFFVSPYSLNHITSFATELGPKGYSSAFFHGGDNESMGFQGFAKGAGFDEYYGRNEYEADPRFGGSKDFDGTWAIWDEEFLQFYALKMTEMPEPFITGVFTATSHHPFAIPDRYRDRFPDEGIHKLHKCIRYTDYALGRFFETASKQPWYNNTIFVLTADHSSSKTTHDEYKTEAGKNRVPILIFDPTGEMPRGVKPGIMQQLDILPSILGWLGHDKDFIAFGNDVFATPDSARWAFNYSHVPQLFMGDYFLQTDRDCNATSIYDYKNDVLMTTDLISDPPRIASTMEAKVKGLMQSYMERMEADSVRVR